MSQFSIFDRRESEIRPGSSLGSSSSPYSLKILPDSSTYLCPAEGGPFSADALGCLGPRANGASLGPECRSWYAVDITWPLGAIIITGEAIDGACLA